MIKLNVNTKQQPILDFLIQFSMFIIIYSMNSILFSKLFINGELGEYLIIKRIVQGVFYLVFVFYLHNKNSVAFDYFGSIKIKTLIIFLLIMFLLYFVYENSIQLLVNKYFPYKSSDSTNTLATLSSNPIAFFLQVCIVAPIAEEVLIRGYLLKTLNGKYTVIQSILITSIIFALTHFDFINTIFYLVIGIFLGIVVIKTKSIYYCIIFHFCLNLYAFISHYMNI